MRIFIAVIFILGCTAILASVDTYETIYRFTRAHEEFELDEILLMIPGTLLVAIYFLASNTWALKQENRARKHAENKLQEALEAAKQQEELKKSFLTQVCHDLNSPIAGLLGMLQLINEAPTSPSNKRYLDLALSSARSLNDIISSSMSLARLERDTPSESYEDFRTHDLLTSCLDRFGPLAHEKKLELSGSITLGTPETIRSHKGIARIILDNLVANGIKFTDQGRVDITLGYDNKNNRLLLDVEDSGHGFTEQEKQSIFQRYFQKDSHNHESRGLGIGLNIACELVKILDGDISVESSAGQGTLFNVSIPLG